MTLRFVDYEVPPLRTTGGATFEGGRPSGGPEADVLLAAADGTAVVGEIKAATATSYDEDAVLALIQGLALVAALATPQQKQRLATTYRDAEFDIESRLGLYLFVVKPPIAVPATNQADLDVASRELVQAIRTQTS